MADDKKKGVPVSEKEGVWVAIGDKVIGIVCYDPKTNQHFPFHGFDQDKSYIRSRESIRGAVEDLVMTWVRRQTKTVITRQPGQRIPTQEQTESLPAMSYIK